MRSEGDLSKILCRHAGGGRAGLCQFFPAGTLRRSSSTKLKKKVTLLTGAFSTPLGAFNTTSRLPSGCKSKVEVGPPLPNWLGDQSPASPAPKESPVVA